MPLNHPKTSRPSNFREVGAEARARLGLRPRVLFRSDHLGALEADAVRQIELLGIRRVIDFRGVDERAQAMCALKGVTVHSLAIEPTVVQKLTQMLAEGVQLSEADMVAIMEETYRSFVRHSTHRFAQFFAHLIESDEPTVFHCTAGKDRTGFAAALLLHALGASKEEIMRDYLLTNERLIPPQIGRGRLTPQAAAVLWRVQPEFLQAAFEVVDRDYGGLDAYISDGLGLRRTQRERLAELYLRAATRA